MFPAIRCARRPPSSLRSLDRHRHQRPRRGRLIITLLGRVERSPERHRQPRSEISYKRTKIATSAAGASRSVAAALRRLGRVGPVTPMRAVPLARACGQRVWQTPSRREPLGRRSAPAAGAGRSAHADARRAPRARVWAASMANAEPARAARSPQRSGGWGGSVCSRRCAPCPSRARVGSEYGKRRAGASRSVAAALRRLGRVGLLTPMRAVPLARACGQRVWQTPPISEAISAARAERALVRRNSPSGVLRTSTA